MSTMEKNEKNQAVLTFEVDAAAMEAATEKVYRKNIGRYAIPGFRKGHAPRKMVEKYYGAGVFFEDAFNDVFPDLYDAAVKEHELEPVDRPDVAIDDIKDDGTVVVKATVTLKPEVKLGKYEGIKLEKIEYTVSDEDVEHEIQHALDHASRMVDIDNRPVKDGDTVGLNYSGSVDGEKFEGGTAENQTLAIGSGTFIPGFEEQMIGMNIGEEKDLTVKFPEDYHAENLKGKDAVFHVKVLSIKEKQVPALDDEFAKDVSEFDTLEAYRADIRKNLEENKKKQAETEMENKLIEAVADACEVDIPDCMIESQIDYQVRDMEMRMSYQGLKMEDYLKYTGMTMEQLRGMYREDAKKSVKIRLVLDEIVKAEKIEADDASVEAEIVKMAENAKKETEEFKKTLTPDYMDYIKQSVVMNKTLEMLKAKNPAKKVAAKKASDKPTDEEAKPAAKKTAAKKTADGEAKPAAKKPAAKKAPAKKTEKTKA